MATKAKKAAQRIAALKPTLGFHCVNTTDPAVGGVEHTAFFLELDKPTQSQVMAAKLEAEAAMHRVLADAHTKIAGILKSRG